MLMNSKGIFTGIAKQYRDKEMLFVDPKSDPKMREPNVKLFGCLGSGKASSAFIIKRLKEQMREGLNVDTVNHHVIVSSGNGGKNRKYKTIHAERE